MHTSYSLVHFLYCEEKEKPRCTNKTSEPNSSSLRGEKLVFLQELTGMQTWSVYLLPAGTAATRQMCAVKKKRQEGRYV